MDLERLKSLGFCLIAGQVDYQGKNYGTFNAHGALLTDEGDELVAQLEDDAARGQTKTATRAAAPKAARGREAKPTAPPAAPDPAPEESGLADGLGGMLGQE